MKVTAQRVSKLRGESAYCCPAEGYDQSVVIELEEYEEIEQIEGGLPPSDKDWPMGAPFVGYACVNGKVLRKKNFLSGVSNEKVRRPQ